MKKYIIEVEEAKAETVVNLLAQISVKVGKPIEAKKHYIKIIGFPSDSFLCVTEEQMSLLRWLENEGHYSYWEEIDPTHLFEEV